jgi:hypothetical protein
MHRVLLKAVGRSWHDSGCTGPDNCMGSGLGACGAPPRQFPYCAMRAAEHRRLPASDKRSGRIMTKEARR